VQILRLIQRHSVSDEIREKRKNSNKEFLFDASDSFVAVTEAIERTRGDFARHNHQSSWLLGLGHGSEDEHGRDGLEVDTEFSVLDAHGVREVLAEGLGATISTEIRSRHSTISRRDSDDGTSLLFAHVGEEGVSEAEDRLAVDVQDVNFFASGNGSTELLVAGVRKADVVDEDGDVQARELFEESLVVSVRGGREVEGDGLGLDLEFRFKVNAEVVQDFLSAGDGDDVEATFGELDAVGFTNALRGASDNSPVASLSVLGLEVSLDEEVDTDETEDFKSNNGEDNSADSFETALATEGHFFLKG
jgi:hypothetical protein